MTSNQPDPSATNSDTTIASSPTPPPYHIRTSSLPPSALGTLIHHVDPANHRLQLSLGDSTGLARTGVHYCRLPARATSTTPHWHARTDEWMFVLAAAPGAVLLVSDALPASAAKPDEGGESEGDGDGGQAAVVLREEPIQAGDFLGFKAGVARAHALRAGAEGEVVYLLGGSREPLDVSTFPTAGRRVVAAPHAGGFDSWSVGEADPRVQVRTAPARLAF